MFYLGSAKQASDFETTAEYLINHIKGTYDYGQDIATALTEGSPCDMTVHKLTMSVSKLRDDDATVRDQIQGGFLSLSKVGAELPKQHFQGVSFPLESLHRKHAEQVGSSYGLQVHDKGRSD